jgi:hypothetical protein
MPLSTMMALGVGVIELSQGKLLNLTKQRIKSTSLPEM